MPRHPSPYRCQFCRRRKKKCDGQRPCHACQKAKIECVYDIPQPTSIDATGRLPKPYYLKPKPAEPEPSTDASQQNRDRHNKIEKGTADAVTNNQSHLAAKDATPQQTDDDGNIKLEDPEFPLPSIESPTSQGSGYISETDDGSESPALPRPPPYASAHGDWPQARVLSALDKILQWDCIAFCLIDADRFKRDLQTGSHKYCSPALVDALLALSVIVFRYDAMDEVSDRDTGKREWDFNSSTLANKAIEALNLGTGLPEVIADIQALGVLALYYACDPGNDKSCNFAVDFAEAIRKYCLHKADTERAVTTTCRISASTYCGAISMNRVMVQIHKYYLNLPVNLRETPSYEMEFNNGGICDDQSWTEHLLQATLSNEMSATNPDLRGPDIYAVAAELYRLIEQVFKTCCGPEPDHHTFADATATYVKGLEWYQNFFKYSEAYTGREPLILFVHTYYHFCILSLFTPYVTDMTLVSDGSTPGKICEEAATIILKLLRHYDGGLAGDDTEPVGLMRSFKNASVEFLDFYGKME